MTVKTDCQIAQLEEHLTRDSVSSGSNSGLGCHYFFYSFMFGSVPTLGTDRLTPAWVKSLGIEIFDGEDLLREEKCDGQNSSVVVPDSLADITPD